MDTQDRHADFGTLIIFVLQGYKKGSENLNPLPDMPILGSSNSAANKDVVAKEWPNGDTII